MSADTIVNCFKHCGMQSCTDEATDLFADLDEESEDEQEGDGGSQDEELQELVQQFDPDFNAGDYVNANEDLPICDTYTCMTRTKIGERNYVMKCFPVVKQRNRLLVKVIQMKIE